MALLGQIYDYAKDEMGFSWDALIQERGEEMIERRLRFVTQRFMAVTLDETLQNALNPIVAVYLAKLLCLQLIGPAIEYWSRQALRLTTQGRVENKEWKDRAEDLRYLYAQLLADVADLEDEVGPLIPVPRPKQASVPFVRDVADDAAITPDPNLMDPLGDITLNPNFTGT